MFQPLSWGFHRDCLPIPAVIKQLVQDMAQLVAPIISIPIVSIAFLSDLRVLSSSWRLLSLKTGSSFSCSANCDKIMKFGWIDIDLCKWLTLTTLKLEVTFWHQKQPCWKLTSHYNYTASDLICITKWWQQWSFNIKLEVESQYSGCWFLTMD